MHGRRVRHAQAAPAVLALSVACLAPRAAFAQGSEGGGVILTWEAPPGCPDREAMSRRLVDALADAPPGIGAGWAVRGRVHAGRERSWVLVLGLTPPGAVAGAPPAERVLSARDCDDLGEAAAVAIAIALDDAQRASEGAPAASAASGSDPAAVAAPPAREPATDAAAVGTALPGAAREPLRLALAAGGVLDSASLGGLAWGASLELQGWWRRFGGGVYGLWLPPRTTDLGTAQLAQFSLLGGGVRACYRAAADWLWVSPCVGVELARYEADSAGLRQGRDVRDLWLAGIVGIGFASPVLGALGLHSRVELVLPGRRQEYLVDEADAVHRVPAAALRWLVGVVIDAGGG